MTITGLAPIPRGVGEHQPGELLAERRWIIHKPDGGFSGPMTAAQIRESLRKGELDPSTMVSLEGSAIKREIFSTDELFQTEETLYHDQAADPTKIVDTIKGKSRFLGLAAPDEAVNAGKETGLRPRGRDGKRKKYFLTDKSGKISKKMSAAEVLYLYKKGRLSRETRVSKESSSQSIGVREFVRAYQTGGSKALKTEKPGGGWDQNKSMVVRPLRVEEPKPAKGGNPLSPRLVIFTLAVAGLVILGIWLLSEGIQSPSRVPPPMTDSLPKMPLPTAEISEPAARQEPKAPDAKLRDSKASRQPLRNPPPPRPAKETKIAVPGISGEVTPSLEGLEQKVGQIFIFGPLSFSSRDLKNCTVKCEIRMRDQGGKDVLVIFFKAAYIAQLSGSDSRIFIQATVGAQGKSLYLSKVFRTR